MTAGHQFAERVEVGGEGPTKTYIDGPVDTVNLPGSLRHERLTTEELHTVQMLHDKFQMQKDVDVESAREMVARFQEVHGEKWRQVLTLAAAAQDSLKDFKPLGWFGFGRYVWYDEPIYNALVKEFGFDPLADHG